MPFVTFKVSSVLKSYDIGVVNVVPVLLGLGSLYNIFSSPFIKLKPISPKFKFVPSAAAMFTVIGKDLISHLAVSVTSELGTIYVLPPG